MIPLQLTLTNFLSYRKATLDFRGLHTACICGANGAGKSSLLEAITWAIWGESRAATEDDVIHSGADEVQVDFIFQNQAAIYRVFRARRRGGGAILEFQVQTPSGYRPLTERGMRSTQQLILDHLKLDYDTFINSAYLRQGRADEFMLRKPAERKQILADLLKLSQYEELAEKAKDLSKQFKGQADQIEQNLQSIKLQLQQGNTIAEEQSTTEAQIATLQQAQSADNEQLQRLQALQHQRQTWEQQLIWQQQQYQNLQGDIERLQQDLAATQQQQQDLENLLSQSREINAGYTLWQNLQAQEEVLAVKFQSHQKAIEQRRKLQEQQTQVINELNLQLRQIETKLQELDKQSEQNQQILNQSGEVETALTQLQQARIRLTKLDELQLQVSPLLQRRQQLQNQVSLAHAKLSARLDEISASAAQLQAQQKRQPQLQQAVMEVATQIDQLEKKRVYQLRVQEKGLERRSFQDRLEENKRECEKKTAELQKKLEMLQNPHAICPLCDRPLDEHHWNRVVQKTETEQQEVQQDFWVVQEQLAVCAREIHVLRAEYRQLSQELASYDSLREQRGQLQAQLQATGDVQNRLQLMTAEVQQLERSLSTGDYAIEVQQELRQLEQQLQQLSYDEKNHALARNEVERWRWAEIKQDRIKEAQRRQTQIATRRPELMAEIAEMQRQIEQQQTDSDLSREIAAINRKIAEINYKEDEYNSVRSSVRQGRSWELRYQQLTTAQQQYPQLRQRCQELAGVLSVRSQDLENASLHIKNITQQLQQIPNTIGEIQRLEQQMQWRKSKLEEQLRFLGSLQQQQEHLEALNQQYQSLNYQLAQAKRQYKVHHALAEAFGKKGIQAYMIENILPQLEAETNSLLARLTGNQLHVQFVTQKASRSGRTSAKKDGKMIDTLDILIADARGTRPYETYSGGEAFRINFAIRLALARLLAQRAGTALQLLIVDEGFGTQDQEGCDRLIAAINAIAGDFACILTVTHMPYFKEAFQARIEVNKTGNGSQLNLSM